MAVANCDRCFDALVVVLGVASVMRFVLFLFSDS